MSYPPLMDDSQKHREEPTMKNSNSTSKIEIREVWSHNLEQEFAHIREIVDDYPYLAMDTEFPGIVVRHVKRTPDYNYQTMKANVDMLKLIQLGLTFSDANGNLPVVSESGKPCVWQFNFREFDLRSDLYAADSIELLQRSGIDFSRNRELGIDAGTFAELLMPSGVVLNDSVRWITFHSAYDFGYLLKLLTCRKLPPSEPEFLELLRLYFPTIYDVKHLMRFCGDYHLHGGLDRLAQLLQVKRHGCSHQAGSDSLLTSSAYLSLLNRYFNGCAQKYAGVLYGLGSSSDFAGALSPAAGC